jgi:hypothetical protein
MIAGIFLLVLWCSILLTLIFIIPNESLSPQEKRVVWIVLFLISLINISGATLAIIDSSKVITSTINKYEKGYYSPIYTIQGTDTLDIKYVLKERKDMSNVSKNPQEPTEEISQQLVDEFLNDNAIEALYSEENFLCEVSDENEIS